MQDMFSAFMDQQDGPNDAAQTEVSRRLTAHMLASRAEAMARIAGEPLTPESDLKTLEKWLMKASGIEAGQPNGMVAIEEVFVTAGGHSLKTVALDSLWALLGKNLSS